MKRLLWDRRHFGISRSSMTFRHKWIGRFKATQDLQLKAGALRVDTQAQAEMHQQKAPQKHQKTLETEWSNRSIAFSLGRFFKMPCNDPPSLHTFDALQRSKRHQKRGKCYSACPASSAFLKIQGSVVKPLWSMIRAWMTEGELQDVGEARCVEVSKALFANLGCSKEE